MARPTPRISTKTNAWTTNVHVLWVCHKLELYIHTCYIVHNDSIQYLQNFCFYMNVVAYSLSPSWHCNFAECFCRWARAGLFKLLCLDAFGYMRVYITFSARTYIEKNSQIILGIYKAVWWYVIFIPMWKPLSRHVYGLYKYMDIYPRNVCELW